MTRLCELKCQACNKDTTPLSFSDALDIANSELNNSNWKINPTYMESVLEFSRLEDAAQYLQAIAVVADAENHHPEIIMESNYFKTIITIRLHTFAIKALSYNDFILAAKIDDSYDTLFSR